MSDYIKREEVIAILERLRDKCGNDEMSFALNWAANIVKGINAADVRPVVKATWIQCNRGSGFKCSVCKARVSNADVVYGNHRFCYKCGAEMEKGELT